MKKTLTISAAALAAALALAGCSAGSGSGSSGTGSMSGMNHGSSGMSSDSAPATSAAAMAEFNDADTMFAQMMMPHHVQAVTMSDIMLKKAGLPPAVTDLATKIKAAQGPEIEKMTSWLQSWGQPTMMPTEMSSAHSMEGMMGEDDMAKLEAAQSAEAAKLFLTQMIAHHEGAVMMAKTETTNGKNADAVQLSEDIVSSQDAEIQEMKDLLATL
ncbi:MULTISPECIES: DUF305 domain-containing protein [Paenarthrobacter]|jgi:uncharacterized protein (DUF305 family)|uniref:DUF305 domain-containing protein n=1 Tax=Paenarthrobacter ureafaciens TaxID=37931 RepID=A0AAX3EDQ2_PAEUR|nr:MULTISPECIES: DUF305 domain-containing protein [Paenarthrobacter]NKR12309.1 DUF305 domain-containing protein [Arthrobacter sp. M5]NKR15633.1 DUF305 domain-containing protein [Arthrobacter sp. M6]OEH62282.1 DUF305 domain-containing protein [Arthrobacter sp. D4]OEH62853.1 DUF305 domain-containing protein [Arthrobacter sp. D2]MDO5865008.1 DUF305 domain-containing protein [Paenarthrobacter sp. SD-2]